VGTVYHSNDLPMFSCFAKLKNKANVAKAGVFWYLRLWGFIVYFESVILLFVAYNSYYEELDGRAVSALSVRSRKLSIVRRGQSLDGWPKICSRYHPLHFQGGLTSGRRPVVKINAESLSQHDEKHVVPTPLSGIRVRRRSIPFENIGNVFFNQIILIKIINLIWFYKK
jgi:hypothetical protein